MLGLGNTNLLSGAQVANLRHSVDHGPVFREAGPGHPDLRHSLNIVKHFNKLHKEPNLSNKMNRRHPLYRAQNPDRGPARLSKAKMPTSQGEEVFI